MLSTFRNGLAATASAVVLGLALMGNPAAADETVSIVRAPTDLPAPLEARGPEVVDLHLTTIEKTARLNDGTTYRYWTFDGGVPGPFLRVRAGDTVNITLTNAEDSWMPHNIDLHAVTGPHGGGDLTLVEPGETRGFTFKALKPGLYVYHCATPVVAHHIAAGMYGLILVEPEGGLPAVDREFYVMQGEIYTEDAFGSTGEQYDSLEKLLDERPEYYVFNGSVGGLVDEAPLTAKVGETIRIYFGVGGPNKSSSFHVIGEIFDKVYQFGSFTEGPISDVQTVSVAPGGAVAVDITLDVPGNYALVDHALSRMERGLVAHLLVEGEENPDLFGPLPNEQLSMLP